MEIPSGPKLPTDGLLVEWRAGRPALHSTTFGSVFG